MARNGSTGSQTHICRSRTTSATSASRVHWTIDNRHVQNIYCKQYNSPVFKDNPMKTRVHCTQTTDMSSTITSTTTSTTKPRTTSASQVHQTMDVHNQHITNISYQTTKLTTKSASQEYWTSTTPIRTTDSTSTTIKTTMRRAGVTKLQPTNLF